MSFSHDFEFGCHNRGLYFTAMITRGVAVNTSPKEDMKSQLHEEANRSSNWPGSLSILKTWARMFLMTIFTFLMCDPVAASAFEARKIPISLIEDLTL